ncbi:MAG: succinylglutamate desuccinylase/aspartoacylase family protein [Pseudomonadota bacterium]
MSRVAFHFGGDKIEPGTRGSVDLPVGTLTDHTPVRLPVHVVHGRKAGPTVLVCAAIHGDEIVGVEIIRRLLAQRHLNQLRGTLMAVPIVNAFGFLARSRYLPDRRDLNRCFPGSPHGSLASRLANIFLGQVVARADLVIDLHSAAVHRTNLPQIRVNPDQPRARELAKAFGAPVFMVSRVLEGSLREAAAEMGVDTLLYEAGEALRFDEPSVRVGLRGILRVLRTLDMLPARRRQSERVESIETVGSQWVRAEHGGLFRGFKGAGDTVEAGDLLGVISDPFGANDIELQAPETGIVIGRTQLPLVHQGDALFHVAGVRRAEIAEQRIEAYEAALQTDPMFDDDDEII